MNKIKFKIEIPNDIRLIYNIFKENGYNLYLVGGAVRDAYIGESIKDYDLASEVIPDKIIKLLGNKDFIKNIILTGKAFGVINVLTTYGNEYEIATFRSDGEYNDNRRPDSIVFGNIQDDANRRDLSCNSLYYDIENKEIIDYVGGIEDLKNKIIRMVGKAEDRIKEDGLRSIRIIRFSARFESFIDDDIDKALKTNPNLENISKERIRDEFIKGIQSAKSTIYFLNLIQKYGLFKYIFNDLNINSNFIHEKDYVILISYLVNNTLNKLRIEKELNELKYTIDEIKIIKFLLNLNNLNISTAYELKKQQNQTKITDEQILKFGKLIHLNDELLNYFINYKLTITGEFIMKKYNIPQGKQVGMLINLLENQVFIKLIN